MRLVLRENEMMEIGIKIKEMRLKKQLTQEELADRCELTKGYISQIEKNDEKIDYMSSDLYVDQFARENLGYIGAGEELFVGK